MSDDSAKRVNGQQAITAVAAIYRFVDEQPQILLAKRAQTKAFLPGIFELPGGHIDFGESLEHGLQRELREELSIEVELEDPFAAFTYMNEVKSSHSVEIVFLARLIGEERILTNPADHSEVVWANHTLAKMLYEEQRPHTKEQAIVLKAIEIVRKKDGVEKNMLH